MKAKPAVTVLEALLIGLEVEIPYLNRKFKVRMENDVLVYDVIVEKKSNESGEWDKEVMEARLDMPLDLFVRACNSMEEKDLWGIRADIALNSMRRKRP